VVPQVIDRGAQCLRVGGRICWRPGPSMVDVPAPPPTIGLGSELALKLHQAPDLHTVGTDVGLDVGGHLADGDQVDAEELGTSLERCRDRPAQVQVMPGLHGSRASNTRSRSSRQSCLPRPEGPEVHQGRCRIFIRLDAPRPFLLAAWMLTVSILYILKAGPEGALQPSSHTTAPSMPSSLRWPWPV
jgi:hypothetical protein